MGYIDPDNFLGGRITLDKDASVRAVQGVADALGMGLMETAAGIAKIAEFKMADIIRKTTVEKGFDPRDFSLFAFGGAGPVHAGVFARELGVKKVLIPLNRVASTWCAFGAATADILHIHEHVEIQSSPFTAKALNDIFRALADKAHAAMTDDGISKSKRSLTFSIDMRHRGQINEVEVSLMEIFGKQARVNAANLADILQAFYARYEAIYGKGSSYGDARLEMVTFRVRARAATQPLSLPKATRLQKKPAADAVTGARKVYWSDLGKAIRTTVMDGGRLRPGNQVAGPVIVETTETTIVVQPHQTLSVDAWGNFELNF